jgi:membrane peptidoglycan carboxypeptidase
VRPRRHRFRRVKRLLGVVTALAVLGGITFAGLMLVLPGHGYYGLAAASCGYFAEQPARLSWGQAAMLAGLVQAPSADDPLSHFANARAREAHVLIRLIATGTLTPTQAAQAFREPLHLVGGKAARCA